jgi:predicted SAM-dependent methyltransferase
VNQRHWPASLRTGRSAGVIGQSAAGVFGCAIRRVSWRAVDERTRASEFARYVLADQRPPPPPTRGGALLRMFPAWAPGAFRRVTTLAMRPLAARRWERLAGRRPLRLHLGCGWTPLRDWVNVDLFATKADIPWDLRAGIPLRAAAADAIFHEHMLEHLSLRDGFLFTQECLRVLAPGGVLRIGVPDAGACIDSYSGAGPPDWAASRPTGMLAVEALFYENGHLAMYDAETLVLLCRAAGFAEVERREAGLSWIEPCPDTLQRASGTLYVDARKAR